MNLNNSSATVWLLFLWPTKLACLLACLLAADLKFLSLKRLCGRQLKLVWLFLHRNEDERMEFRKQKFGVYDKNAEEIKRLQRAKRFGLVTQELEEEKKKVRATRFGTRTTSPKNVQKGNTIAPLVVTTDENEKRIRRAERFGIVPSHQEVSALDNLLMYLNLKGLVVDTRPVKDVLCFLTLTFCFLGSLRTLSVSSVANASRLNKMHPNPNLSLS